VLAPLRRAIDVRQPVGGAGRVLYEGNDACMPTPHCWGCVSQRGCYIGGESSPSVRAWYACVRGLVEVSCPGMLSQG